MIIIIDRVSCLCARKVAFTALNAHSSRSHAIVMLTVIKRRRLGQLRNTEVQKIKVPSFGLKNLGSGLKS